MQHRRREAEVMDDPALDSDAHRQALDGLRRVNAISGSVRIVAGPIRALAARCDAPLRVLDIATGGGDVAIGLKRLMPHLDVRGCDISPCAIDYAARQGSDVRWFVADALRDPLPDDCDVVMCNLFLHHLSDEDAVALLSRMAGATKRMVLVNDLRRSAMGLAVAAVGTRMLTRSRVVHVDGPRSVAAAFTMDEAKQLSANAGLTGARVEPRFPWRWLMRWERP